MQTPDKKSRSRPSSMVLAADSTLPLPRRERNHTTDCNFYQSTLPTKQKGMVQSTLPTKQKGMVQSTLPTKHRGIVQSTLPTKQRYGPIYTTHQTKVWSNIHYPPNKGMVQYSLPTKQRYGPIYTTHQT